MRGEVAVANNKAWMEKLWFFQDANDAFVVEISQRIHPLVFAPVRVSRAALVSIDAARQPLLADVSPEPLGAGNYSGGHLGAGNYSGGHRADTADAHIRWVKQVLP